MHIAFVIPTLDAGGAQRVATLLSNYWARDGHSVDLISFEDPGSVSFYELRRVRLHWLGAMDGSPVWSQTIRRNVRRLSRLRSLLQLLRPDIVIAFMTEANVLALIASRGLGIPVVISERNQPERPGLGALHRIARRTVYGWSDAIVTQTEAIAAWARTRFPIPVHVISNPVIPVSTVSPVRADYPARLKILAVGRLVEQKGFDILVDSFAAIANEHPDWDVVIYGEGPQRDRLQRRIRFFGLERRIILPGLTNDIVSALKGASLFVVPSRYEGCPNVLIEALACGLPVVATDCAGGTAEIVDSGFYARLVPPDDANALSEALASMMSDSQLRAEYSARAPLAVTRLDISLVSSRWIELMDGLRQQTSAKIHARVGKTLRT